MAVATAKQLGFMRIGWRGTWTCRNQRESAGYFWRTRPSKGVQTLYLVLTAGPDSKAVDDLYRLWSDSKAKLISAPESKPWGLHEFTAADPDGNLFRVFYDFATPERAKNA